MGYLSVFGIALYALVMAIFFLASAFSLPPGNAAIPASLSFTAIATLSSAVGFSLKRQGDRTAALERQLTAGSGVA